MTHHEGHEACPEQSRREHEVRNKLLSETFVSFVTFVVQTSFSLHAKISLIATIARITPPSVIPAQAGIQVNSSSSKPPEAWIPAFTGMTVEGLPTSSAIFRSDKLA